jgi:membrane-associated phospholipid phosphatase
MLMLTARRLATYTATVCMVLAILIQQVVTRGFLSDFDKTARMTSRDINAAKDIFSVTVMFGLRGIILTICLPILGWVSWKRRSWIPIAGFFIVLIMETGIAGALKISVGRIFPYQYENFFNRMMIGQDELAFPSGHAANCVALWGYIVWYFTQSGTVSRRVGTWLVVLASSIVGISSWLIRTHWPTDLLAGYAVGLASLLAVIGLYTALGFNPEATSHRSQEVHRETADAQ